MRKLSASLMTLGLALAAGALVPTASEAQVAAATDAPNASVEAREAKFNQFLNLTPDQQAKLRPILVSENEQLEALQKKDGPRDKKVQELWAIGNDTEQKVKAILTPEQLKAYCNSKSLLRPQLSSQQLGSGPDLILPGSPSGEGPRAGIFASTTGWSWGVSRRRAGGLNASCRCRYGAGTVSLSLRSSTWKGRRSHTATWVVHRRS